MKQLLSLSAILLIVGIAAFLYRNTVERPYQVEQGACTLEAKICPDGTSVGRTGPSCAFAPCELPNVEIPDAGISFMVPPGYAADGSASGANLVAAFAKPSTLDWPPHAILIYRYGIPEGKTADDVILESVRYQPSDEQAAGFEHFADVSIAGKTFRETVIERFEGLVRTSYFLARESDVLRFDVVEKGVQGWTDPAFDIRALPEHAALFALLRSFQAAP